MALAEPADGNLRRPTEASEEPDLIWSVLQDLLFIADAKGSLLKVNAAWTSTLGWLPEELVGRSPDWLVHPDDRQKTRAELDRLLSGAVRFENRLRHKDGTYLSFSWLAFLNGARIVASARDTTESKHAEHVLRLSRQAIGQADRQTTMSKMTAAISHEINQPLSAITTNAQAALRWLAREQPDLNEASNALHRVISESRRTHDVVAGIRAIFVKDQRERQVVQISDLICDVLALVHAELESQDVTLQVELSDGLVDIRADRIQLQQVLLNLFNNAIEAMSAIDNRKHVLTVKSQSLDSDTLILVQDTGSGIDPENIEKIFDTFFTTKPHGMGMGLSICRTVIESHGGRLWASSDTAQGTTFYVTLPVGDSIESATAHIQKLTVRGET